MSPRLWTEFRRSVIELDGGKCTMCGRPENEVTLQVHHKRYIAGRKPWEYGTKDCVTLCKGCHAAEHGIIMPQHGWEYGGEEDLGDLSGICEKCGTSIRYVFIVYHEKWGTLEVGTICCDNLTDSKIASNLLESVKRYEGRKERFIDSKRWVSENKVFKIRHSSFDIEVNEQKNGYYLKIHNLESKKLYLSLNDAKATAFDVIESGTLVEYLKNKKINFESTSRQSRKKK